MSKQWTARATLLALAIATLSACNSDSSSPASTANPAGNQQQRAATGFAVTPLLSAETGMDSRSIDGNLLNPSGLIFSDGLAWIANANTGTLSPIDAQGVPQQPIVQLADGNSADARPTGMVFNGAGNGFNVTTNGVTAPATVIYATEAGTLAAWSGAQGFGTRAVTVYDGGGSKGLYKGLAQLEAGGNRFLFATDFRNGRIDTFDTSFARVTTDGDFRDPDLPAGYAPFGIQAVGDRLIVTYAKQGGENDDKVEYGSGRGYVNEFDARGRLVRRLVSGGELDAPWGIALAPDNFGEFSDRLLIANAGDGRINAYSQRDGEFIGALTDATGAPIEIPGLWAIEFGNGTNNQPRNSLFYTAGTAEGEDGAYGRIDVTQSCQGRDRNRQGNGGNAGDGQRDGNGQGGNNANNGGQDSGSNAGLGGNRNDADRNAGNGAGTGTGNGTGGAGTDGGADGNANAGTGGNGGAGGNAGGAGTTAGDGGANTNASGDRNAADCIDNRNGDGNNRQVANDGNGNGNGQGQGGGNNANGGGQGNGNNAGNRNVGGNGNTANRNAGNGGGAGTSGGADGNTGGAGNTGGGANAGTGGNNAGAGGNSGAAGNGGGAGTNAGAGDNANAGGGVNPGAGTGNNAGRNTGTNGGSATGGNTGTGGAANGTGGTTAGNGTGTGGNAAVNPGFGMTTPNPAL